MVFVGTHYTNDRGRRIPVAAFKEGSTLTYYTRGALIEKIQVFNAGLVALHVGEEEKVEDGESGTTTEDRPVPSDD